MAFAIVADEMIRRGKIRDYAELAHIAAQAGAVYKPSGAGGGDVGLLFARSAETLGQTVRLAETVGYRLIDLDIDSKGVQARRYEGQAS